jgi:hypothetical protein
MSLLFLAFKASLGTSLGVIRIRHHSLLSAPILERMKALSAQYPRYGYRRIRIFLGRDGHRMSPGLAYRLWSQPITRAGISSMMWPNGTARSEPPCPAGAKPHANAGSYRGKQQRWECSYFFSTLPRISSKLCCIRC